MWIGKDQTGFTYLAALIAVALFGVVLAATGMVWQTVARREKERELLFVGDQFRTAIGSYYNKAPGGIKLYPRSLEDLLEDKRQPTIMRHVRKIYFDPITNDQKWGVVESPRGGIMGVYSRSEEEPFKVSGFGNVYEEFENKKKYSEWQFIYWPLQSTISTKPAPAQQQPTQQASPLTQPSAQPKFSLPVSPMQIPQQPAK